MPDHEAAMPAFYDHEIDEPRATGRRRRQVADWGVGEDVFDRLPSRRFTRGEHGHADDRTSRARRDERASWDDGYAPAAPARDEPAPRRPRRRPAADWLAEVSPRAETRTIVLEGDAPDEDEPRRTIVIEGDAPVADEPRRATVVEGDAPDVAEPLSERAARADAPRPRRTVVIGGHPDKLPAPRPRRPPRTALERVGASPDRLAAYAVGLGLLLILIAVLTTGH